MGEYAEQYALENDGVDISEPDKKKIPWKWACPICHKNLSSQVARQQHIEMKHRRVK